ncbi:hypothetical protein Pcinc_021116 [Petrolisthes cinctipes]|uniref:Uncharacterized protein n=1 Tax=Petrolisthes cinctipes TaxID=88211 RepID=A0AAE1FHU4_PETCI|nr:hypothetical protein Pcinc_021116 [Petrolisthes cinctipes]
MKGVRAASSSLTSHPKGQHRFTRAWDSRPCSNLVVCGEQEEGTTRSGERESHNFSRWLYTWPARPAPPRPTPPLREGWLEPQPDMTPVGATTTRPVYQRKFRFL